MAGSGIGAIKIYMKRLTAETVVLPCSVRRLGQIRGGLQGKKACSLTIEEADAGLSEPPVPLPGVGGVAPADLDVVESTTGLCGSREAVVSLAKRCAKALSAENLKCWKVA